MKPLLAIVVLVLVAGAAATWFDVGSRRDIATKAPAALEAEVAFSPRGGCARVIAHEIDRAQKSVRLTARSLSADAVVAALAAARKRGVVVEAVLDGTAGATSANALYDVGVAVYLDRQHSGVAGATAVIDDALVIVSTLEISAAEDDAAGTVIIARSPAAAAKCSENWRVHLAHAEALETLPAPTPASASAPAPATKPAPAPSSSPFKTTHRP